MKTKPGHILPLMLFTILSGCIEPVIFENDQNRFELVVDGKLTPEPVDHRLYLGRTSGYGYNDRVHVSGARIILYDGKGHFATYLEDPFKGYYVLKKEQMVIRPGESYFIEIYLNEQHIYRSPPQIMPSVIEADTILARPDFIEEINEYGNLVRKNYVNILLQTPVKPNGEDTYFIWRIEEAYAFEEKECHPLHKPKVCYIQRPVMMEEIRVFSSENLEEGTLSDFMIARVRADPLWEFYEKHFFNVAQHAITKEAFQYWETVRKIAQPTGSIFDTPPAPIPGNIHNINDPEEKILGFFEVSAVDTIRTYTFREDLEPLAITDPCPSFWWQSDNHPACCQCLMIENSSAQRPGYWSE